MLFYIVQIYNTNCYFQVNITYRWRVSIYFKILFITTLPFSKDELYQSWRITKENKWQWISILGGLYFKNPLFLWMKLLRGGVDTYLEKHNWKENMLLKLPCTWHMKQQIVRITAADISCDSFIAYWYFKDYQVL